MICCPAEKGGYHYSGFFATVFSDCIYSPKDYASIVVGLISTGFWMVAQFPQLYQNYKNRTAEALSFLFIAELFLGDFTNLIGCLLSGQMATQTISGMYFVVIDTVMVSQILYLKHKYGQSDVVEDLHSDSKTDMKRAPTSSLFDDEDKPRILKKSESHNSGLHVTVMKTIGKKGNDLDSPSANGPRLFSMALLVGFSLSSVLGPSILFPSAGPHATGYARKLLEDCPVEHKNAYLVWVGNVLGWVSAVFYLGSRVPQVMKNQTRMSVDGLSAKMFFCAFSANATYAASIFLRSVEKQFLLDTLPWLVGSLGTLALDLVILLQFKMYSAPPSTRMEGGVLYQNIEVTMPESPLYRPDSPGSAQPLTDPTASLSLGV